MPDRLNVGVIGLGVMGQRMLDRIKDHPRLCATMIWDANPDTLGLTRARYPEVQAAHNAEQLIYSPGLRSVYIATPPAAHMTLSQTELDAGLGACHGVGQCHCLSCSWNGRRDGHEVYFARGRGARAGNGQGRRCRARGGAQ